MVRMNKPVLLSAVIIMSCMTMMPSQTHKQSIPDYSDIDAIYSPRDDGSRNEERLIEYIARFCADRNIDCKTDPIAGEDYCSLSSNVTVTLGNPKSRDNLIYITPLNSVITDSDTYDNSISIHIMLKLIEQTAVNAPISKRVTFLFAGASGYVGQPCYGIKHFISRTEDDLSSNYDFSTSFITIIDILSIDEPVYLKGSNGSHISETAGHIYNSIHNNAVRLDLNRNRSKNISKYSIDYTSAFGDLTASAVLFTNRDRAGLTNSAFSSEYQSDLDEFFSSWHNQLSEMTLQLQSNNNYIFLNLFGKNIIIPENILLLLLCIGVFILITIRLLMPNIHRMRLSKTIVVAIRFLPLLPMYYLVSFVPYLVSLGIGSLFGNSTAYMNIYFIYLLTVFFVSAQIFFMIRDRYPKFYMMKHSYMFITASIIYSFINMFFFGAIDVMLMFIYLWAVFMITCSNFTGHNYILKFIFYVLSALAYILFVIFGLPDYLHGLSDRAIYEFRNVRTHNAVLAMSTFPFLLIYMRLDTLLKNRIHFISRQSVYRLMLLGVSASYIIILFAVVTVTRLNNTQTEVAVSSNAAAKTSMLTIDSDGHLGQIYITDLSGSHSENIRTRHWSAPIEAGRQPYKISVAENKNGTFTVYDISFAFDRPVRNTSVTLSVPKGYYPFESNFPFSQTDSHDKDIADRDYYTFCLPRNMHLSDRHPRYSSVRFSALAGIDITASVRLEFYNDPDFEIDFPNENVKVSKQFLWTDEISF